MRSKKKESHESSQAIGSEIRIIHHREGQYQIAQVTDTLEQEGVATFKTAFEDLLQKLDDKRRALARERAVQGYASAEGAARGDGHSGVAGANSTQSTSRTRTSEKPAQQ